MEGETNNLTLPAWLRIVLVGRRPKYTVLRVVLLVVTAFVVFKFVLLPIRVSGPSMFPTYKEGGINFVNRMAYLFHEPRRGDVVAIRYAGVKIMLMKRIIALPGETVEFRNGQVFINGGPIDEPYLKLPSNWNRPPVTLAPDHYFVVGDNRSMAIEGHKMGDAARERIIGKVLL